MSRPLDGIRVLALTYGWAGPSAARLLADMGAEVIWLDRMGSRLAMPHSRGFFIYPQADPGEKPWRREMAVIFPWQRNLKAFTLDMAKPEAFEIFKDLLTNIDILLDNLSTRVFENWGMGWEVLHELNPRLIQARMPSQGMTGPKKDYVSWGTMIEATSGIQSIQGYPDEEEPMTCGVAWCDVTAGMHQVNAILMALLSRDKTGKGQIIDMSQSECSTHFIGNYMMDYIANKRVPGFQGNRDPGKIMAPHGVYRCKSGDEPIMYEGFIEAEDEHWIVIAISNDEEWQAFCNVIGSPLWTKDPKFQNQKSRWDNQDELNKFVETWTREQDHYEAMQKLQSRGVAAGAVLNNRELLHDPHLNNRGFWTVVRQPEVGLAPMHTVPWHFSRTPCDVFNPVADVGEHNHYVLADLLGRSEEEIAGLYEKEVIFTGEAYKSMLAMFGWQPPNK